MVASCATSSMSGWPSPSTRRTTVSIDPPTRATRVAAAVASPTAAALASGSNSSLLPPSSTAPANCFERHAIGRYRMEKSSLWVKVHKDNRLRCRPGACLRP